MAPSTLQTILQDAYPACEQAHPLPAHVRKAARALMPCRTAAVGGPSQACPDGPMARIGYHACRHRSCPPCASRQTERWLALQQARLLACDHSPSVFTLPHARTPLGLAHVPQRTTRLLQAVRDTLGPLLAAPHYLGAPPGIIAALHPWSQTLVRHPHVPGLVTGGGRTPAGQWVAVRHGLRMPARVVMAVLRGTMLAALRQAWAREALPLPAARRPHPVLHRLNRLSQRAQTPWHVWSMERYRPGAGGVTSVARSLRGGPLTNARLVAYDGDRVTCTSRARHGEADGARPFSQRLTVPVGDLLQRWRLPVPVPQTRTVRG